MTYESILILCIGAGLVGLALLLWHMSEIIWYVQRDHEDPTHIITDAAFGALLWLLVFGALTFSEWIFDFPKDDQVPIVFLAIGFAGGPWYLLIRWVRWRYGTGDDDGTG